MRNLISSDVFQHATFLNHYLMVREPNTVNAYLGCHRYLNLDNCTFGILTMMDFKSECYQLYS